MLEGCAVIQFNHWRSQSAVTVYGDLHLHQSVLLPSSEMNKNSLKRVFPTAGERIQAWELSHILNDYATRKGKN